ncbi:MAG TPA: amidase family protein, partial [Treponemataceae bacterium]|nr:amidase family protein [Treponemataceae bacterium]
LSPAEIKGLKVALPKEFMEAKGLDPEIARIFESACEWFRSRGATIETVSIPVLEAAIGCYYVIALSEAASNLSRFDGIRYGLRKDLGQGYDELYVATRSDGFNAEVKRRIIIGNYVLSTHFSGDCYKKGMSVRARIQKDVGEVLKKHDILICPTSPTTAFPIGSKVDDPLAMYLSDLYTTFVNLARIPSLSVPFGATASGLPVGVQICAAHYAEEKILKVAKAWEASK